MLTKKVEYLGHCFCGGGGSGPKESRIVETMLNWPIPKDVKAVRGFLDLAGYYRRFVRNYGQIAKPLTELLKKDIFH